MLVFDEELRHDLSVKSVPVRRIGGNGVSAADAENSSLCSLTRSRCEEMIYDTGGVGLSRSDRPAAAARAFSGLVAEEGGCCGSKAPHPAFAGKIDRRGVRSCCC